MAATRTFVTFDRKPSGFTLVPPQGPRVYSEAELAAAREQGRREGAELARAEAARQLQAVRQEQQQLHEGIFRRLTTTESELVGQLSNTLPALALDLARRLLAGYEPPAEVIQAHCREVLEQLYPERENLELIIGSRDAGLLGQTEHPLTERYPGLRIVVDPILQPGDCQVRSRFGLTDGRLSAKLETLERELLTTP